MIGKSPPIAMFVLLSKSRRRVRAIYPTDCTALSAAPLEPLPFTGEVRGVAAVSNAHAPYECVLRVSLDDHFGMSDVPCECGQTATRRRIAVSFLLKRNGNHLFVHCVYGHRSIFLCLQEAVVALDDGPGRFCDRDTCLFSLPRARTQMLHQG